MLLARSRDCRRLARIASRVESVSADGAEEMAAPAVPVASGVGAGDSMVAGIVLGLSRGTGIQDAPHYGVAAAAASVMNPGTALCQREDVERLDAAMLAAAG